MSTGSSRIKLYANSMLELSWLQDVIVYNIPQSIKEFATSDFWQLLTNINLVINIFYIIVVLLI